MTQSKSATIRTRERLHEEWNGGISLIVIVEVRVAPFLWKEIKRWTCEDYDLYPEDATYARTCAAELRDEITGNDSVE